MTDKGKTMETTTREAWEQYVNKRGVYEEKKIKQIYDAKSMKEAIEKMLDHYRLKYDYRELLFARDDAGVITYGFYDDEGAWYSCC